MRTLLLGILLLFFSITSFAQKKPLGKNIFYMQKKSFYHAIGATSFQAKRIYSFGVTYSPRINVKTINRQITISAGTHLGLGFYYDDLERQHELSYGNGYVTSFDLPIMAEINFGHGSSPRSNSKFGGFGGVGLGTSIMNSSADKNDQLGVGIVLNVGIRALIDEASLGLRVSYMINQWGDYSDILNITAFYTLGKTKHRANCPSFK